jgi:endonuclease/exonuclease/phosphatase family metal-dependent hydrolase
LFILSNIGAALPLLLSYLASWINPEKIYWIALLALGYPFLLLFNVFFLAYWLWQRDRMLYLSLFSLVLGLGHIFNYWAWQPITRQADKTAFRLMSYNTHYFNTTDPQLDWLKSQDLMLACIKKNKPQIVCLQEFSGKGKASTERAKTFLEKQAKLPHSCFGGGSSLAIFSQYPILRHELLRFPQSHNAVLWADIQHPKGRIRVYCMHLQSIRLGADADEVFKQENLSSLDERKTLAKYRRIGSKLKRAFVQRADQAQWLAEHLRQSPYPVLLAGDLNDTPISFAYAQVQKGLQDAFVAAGWGLGSTYAGRLPALRIDYIFAGAQFRIYNFWRLAAANYSDHYPILAELAW